MGTRTGNATWQNYPSTATVIDATKLQNIENAIDASAAIADAVPLATSTPVAPASAGYAGTAATASRGDHRHPAAYQPGYPIPVYDAGGFGPRATPIGRRGGSAIGSQKAPLAPFPVYRAFTLTALWINLATAADTGTFNLAIFGSDATGLPSGTRIYQTADTSATSTGIKAFTGLTLALVPGNYWLGFGAKGYGTTRPLPSGIDGSQPYAAVALGVELSFTIGAEVGMSATDYNETTGVWPTTTPMVLTTAASAATAFYYSLTGTVT